MSAITSAFREVLVFFHDITGNWGISIILLTIAIRLLLFPLYRYQMRITSNMKAIQPKQKELQEKFKDKPEEYQRRLMELYKEHKVNPMGGCLPLLVQMPILIALFNVLRAFDFGESHFLWLPSLNEIDPFYILPVLSAVSTWYQMKQTTTDQSQQAMIWIMPVFIGWMSIKFPAGLNLYWVVGNIIAILQQMLMNRETMPAKGEAK